FLLPPGPQYPKRVDVLQAQAQRRPGGDQPPGLLAVYRHEPPHVRHPLGAGVEALPRGHQPDRPDHRLCTIRPVRRALCFPVFPDPQGQPGDAQPRGPGIGQVRVQAGGGARLGLFRDLWLGAGGGVHAARVFSRDLRGHVPRRRRRTGQRLCLHEPGGAAQWRLVQRPLRPAQIPHPPYRGPQRRLLCAVPGEQRLAGGPGGDRGDVLLVLRSGGGGRRVRHRAPDQAPHDGADRGPHRRLRQRGGRDLPHHLHLCGYLDVLPADRHLRHRGDAAGAIDHRPQGPYHRGVARRHRAVDRGELRGASSPQEARRMISMTPEHLVSTLGVDVGQCSSAGIKAVNEDAIGIRIPAGSTLVTKGIVAVIADGVSAAEAGKEASATAVSGFLSDYYSTHDTWSVETSASKVRNALNRWLFSQGQAYAAAEKGHVTTFSALILKSSTAYVFHVGDSRVYRLRDGDIEQITRDHTTSLGNGQRFLARALGINPNMDVDFHRL